MPKVNEEDEVFFRITRPIVFVFAMGVVLWFILAVLCTLIAPAFAHDDDPSHDEWYMSLRQPDNPTASCCGVADAYWCDDISVKEGKTFCAITDDRHIVGRPDLPMGLKVEIPDRKLKWDRGNPTGHAIVFLSSGGAVYCFVQGTLG